MISKQKQGGIEVPSLLVSMPQLGDPRFYQTVVLLIEHSAEGAMGLVINRPLEVCLRDITIPDIQIEDRLKNAPAWYGGPCEPERIWLLQKSSTALEEGMLLGKDMQLAPRFQQLDKSNRRTKLEANHFKVILGYSGWVGGQLEQELLASAWLPVPASEKIVFDTPVPKIWEAAVKVSGFDPSQLASDASYGVH